jgi:hypothetical protein
VSRRREDIVKQANQLIAGIRAAVSAMDYFSSGTLLERDGLQEFRLSLRSGSGWAVRSVLPPGGT